jgi:hypothetical protein
MGDSSYGAILWVYPSEVFPLGVRTKAVSLASTVHFASSYLSSYTLELIYYVGVFGALAVFAAVSGCLFIYVRSPFERRVRLPPSNLLGLWFACVVPGIGVPIGA